MTLDNLTAYSLEADDQNASRREGLLLVLSAVFVSLNETALLIAKGQSLLDLWPLGAWCVCAVGGHIFLSRTLPRRDPYILPVTMLLSGWGLALVARLAPPFLIRQTIWLAISLPAAICMTLLPPGLRPLRRYRYSWFLAGLALLAATLILGVNPSGQPGAPRLWLGFGVIYFQPSEALKLLLIIFLASYLADKREILLSTYVRFLRWKLPSPPYVTPMLLMWGFCAVLLVWQRDLGAAALFFLIFLAMLYTSTGQAGYVVAGIILLGLASIAGYSLYDVIKLRLDAWWDPWPEASDRSFQIVQSLLAVASGGVFGQGIGLGSPTFVPVVHSDFVFAAIAEEWGLAGTLGVILCFYVLTARAFRIALLSAHGSFKSLLATGIGVGIGIQALLIVAGVLKLAPLTGVTLPFVSYGGSSLLVTFIMIGLLLRLSDTTSRVRLKLNKRKDFSL